MPPCPCQRKQKQPPSLKSSCQPHGLSLLHPLHRSGLPSRFRGCETSPGLNPAAGAGRDTDTARATGGAALPSLAMLEERCRLPWPCWGNLGRLRVKASAGPAVPGGQRCRGGAAAVWRVKSSKVTLEGPEL